MLDMARELGVGKRASGEALIGQRRWPTFLLLLAVGMSEERRARRTSSKPGNLSTGPAERERLPVRMPAPATTRTEPVRPRSTIQRSSVQAAQHQPSQPNTAGSTHSLATNSISRSTPISLHGAHPGRGGDMTPIPLAHRGSSKKLQKSSKSAEDERKPLHANRHNQRPPSVQRVGLGFDFPTSSEEPIPRPTPSSSQSSARSSALKYSSFSDDSDDDDRLATEPQPRPIPLRPASLSPVPRVSPGEKIGVFAACGGLTFFVTRQSTQFASI